jgi:hypothetical protein
MYQAIKKFTDNLFLLQQKMLEIIIKTDINIYNYIIVINSLLCIGILPKRQIFYLSLSASHSKFKHTNPIRCIANYYTQMQQF